MPSKKAAKAVLYKSPGLKATPRSSGKSSRSQMYAGARKMGRAYNAAQRAKRDAQTPAQRKNQLAVQQTKQNRMAAAARPHVARAQTNPAMRRGMRPLVSANAAKAGARRRPAGARRKR